MRQCPRIDEQSAAAGAHMQHAAVHTPRGWGGETTSLSQQSVSTCALCCCLSQQGSKAVLKGCVVYFGVVQCDGVGPLDSVCTAACGTSRCWLIPMLLSASADQSAAAGPDMQHAAVQAGRRGDTESLPVSRTLWHNRAAVWCALGLYGNVTVCLMIVCNAACGASRC